jgi:hypothetical protein
MNFERVDICRCHNISLELHLLSPSSDGVDGVHDEGEPKLDTDSELGLPTTTTSSSSSSSSSDSAACGNTRCTGTPSPNRRASRRIFCLLAAASLGIANVGESGLESPDDVSIVVISCLCMPSDTGADGEPGTVCNEGGCASLPTRSIGGRRPGKRARQARSQCPAAAALVEPLLVLPLDDVDDADDTDEWERVLSMLALRLPGVIFGRAGCFCELRCEWRESGSWHTISIVEDVGCAAQDLPELCICTQELRAL